MNSVANKPLTPTQQDSRVVQTLYETYAKKLLAYTCKNYGLDEDTAWALVYKTIYKMAEVIDKYTFENDHKRTGFVFKTHINFLRNYFRDRKSFESNHLEVEMNEHVIAAEEHVPQDDSIQMKILKKELDKMEEWQRILLLMRGQNIPYSEIVKFVDKPENQLKVYYARLKQELLEKMNKELSKLNTGADEK